MDYVNKITQVFSFPLRDISGTHRGQNQSSMSDNTNIGTTENKHTILTAREGNAY